MAGQPLAARDGKPSLSYQADKRTPSALVSSREAAYAELAGLLWAYRFGDDGTPTRVDAEAVAAELARSSGWLWLHFNLSDKRARRWLEHCSAISDKATAFLLSADTRQRIEYCDGALV